MSLLLVAATKAEAAYLPATHGVLITGVGKTAAATAVATALATDSQISEVVNLGTAGALRPGIEGLQFPSAVLNHDLSAEVVRALGYDPQELLEIPGEGDVVLASGDQFITDPAVRDALAARAHLVDMEGYAVVWACRAAGVPVRLVKHVSDNADAGAMSWPALVDASARVLADWVSANL